VRADVHRFGLIDPGDVSGLRRAIDAGHIEPGQIVAVIGKTHGNGLVNDYTRGYLMMSLSQLIGGHTGESAQSVCARVPFIFSGGVEGVLSPHYTVFTVSPDGGQANGPALAVGVAFTPPLRPENIGRQRQIDLTAAAVAEAMSAARIASPADVHFVQVKGPAFALADIVEAVGRGRPCATDNPGKLMAFGRAASALGVAKALGEIDPARAIETAVLKDFDICSSVASVSAGGEVSANEVVVVGTSASWAGPLTIGHAAMSDPLDIASVVRLVREMGFHAEPQIPAVEAARIRAAFVKCEAPRDGLVRGKAHTMLNDGDMDQQRHIRGAVGAMVASVLNDTALFVSGGAEHQGPDKGGMIAVIAEKPGLAPVSGRRDRGNG
jgi:cyanuric acid amidohydrolase